MRPLTTLRRFSIVKSMCCGWHSLAGPAPIRTLWWKSGGGARICRDSMSEIVSRGEFARRAGRTPAVINRWIERNQLSGSALAADGRIVVEEAERQLAATLDPRRGRPPGLTHADAGRGGAAGRDRRLLKEIADIRLARERLVLAEAERAAVIARSELVNAAAAERAWRRAMAELIAALEEFVVGLPATLGLGNAEAEVARREWREFRQRRAQQVVIER